MIRSINRLNVVILALWVIAWSLLMGQVDPPLPLNLVASFAMGFLMGTVFPPVRYRF